MNKFKKSFFFIVLSLLIIIPIFITQAQENKRQTIIVLDASGSMWGQIEGKAKIDIAREVIKELLKDWDSQVLLGITAYGHRKKGDCHDIESIYPVSKANAENILAKVNAITPKGMTPLSQAVKVAAEELKFTEKKATVILLSDGKETCNMDPCELGKELEKKGVDFTAHVIGFDVKKEEQAGLKCLAENTGGLFLSAKNSAELKRALSEASRIVAEKPPEVKGKGKIWLDKNEFTVGEEIKVHFEASGNFHESAWIGIIPTNIEHGSEARNDEHDVTYQYLKNRTKGTLIFKAPGRIDNYDFRMHDTDHSGNEIASVSFTMKEAVADLKLDKKEFVTGELITLHFKTGTPLAKKAWVGIIPSNIPHGSETTNDQHDIAYKYLEGKSEGTFSFVAPSKEGSYDFRLNDTDANGKEIASITFKVSQGKGNLSLNKKEVSPGESIQVTFKVPDGLSTKAWIGIIPSNIPHGSEETNDQHDVAYQYLKGQSSGTLTFTAPAQPGSYDFRAHDTDNNGSEIGSVTFIVK